jgi:hypothetical protein
LGALGLATTLQLVPFHCSMSVSTPVAVESYPTATQWVLLVHETAESVLFGAGFGLETLDQADPFHDSTNVLVRLVVPKDPTATQLVFDTHDTPLSEFAEKFGALGPATTDHEAPFHRSTNDALAPAV